LNLLQDILTYVRRYIKTPTDAQITDALLIDYINRFMINDFSARLQLFDFKKKYQFQTVPGRDRYNMPLYDIQTQPGGQDINFYPVYQQFFQPAYVSGRRLAFYTESHLFEADFPNYVQESQNVATGDGGATYSFTLPNVVTSTNINPPVNTILQGHVDMAGIVNIGVNQDPPVVSDAEAQTRIPLVPTTSYFPAVYITSTGVTNNSVVVSDSGFYLDSNQNYGLLISRGNAPSTATPLGTYSTTTNTINYRTGQINVTFPEAIQSGAEINVQYYYIQPGLPTSVLFKNNILTLRTVPDRAYLVELDAYLTPAAFLATTDPVQFGYMSEYIALGAARKILADTGDIEQLSLYERFFKEQELNVLRRSDRQRAQTRVETIYSHGQNAYFPYNNQTGNY
jgi:hypothetical protein